MIWLVLLLLALAAPASAALTARARGSAAAEESAPAVVRPGWRVRPDILVARDDADGGKIGPALGAALATPCVCDARRRERAKRRLQPQTPPKRGRVDGARPNPKTWASPLQKPRPTPPRAR